MTSPFILVDRVGKYIYHSNWLNLH